MTIERYYDEEKLYHKKNRDYAKDPKSNTLHWCEYCDANLVHAGEKCGVCGKRARTGRCKK